MRTALETDRLLLRRPIPDDWAPFCEIHGHPDVLGHTSRATGRQGVPKLPNAWLVFAGLLGHWEIRGYGQWTVIEKASSEIIGRVGLWYPEGADAIELGWVIRRSRWGQGLATEAARAAMRHGFDDVHADHLISVMPETNTRSVRVAEKLGEVLERTDEKDGTRILVYGIHA